jgi:tetratricopeptide (TPR) repeat protein
MTPIDSGTENSSPSLERPLRGLRRWAVPVATVVGAFLLLGVGLPWLKLLTPHWVVIRAEIFFLWFLLGAFTLAMPAAAFGLVWSWTALSRARRGRDRTGFVRAMKWALLSSSCMASLIVMEAAVRFMDYQSYRIPDPHSNQKQAPHRRGTEPSDARKVSRDRLGAEESGLGDVHASASQDVRLRDGTDINILVLGESSARGEPYDPWVSVGQIVGWKLESVFPERTVNVDVRARGGFCLEQALLPLRGLDYKPDAIILFSGHNEFHTRYGWSRNVAHYAEEGVGSLLGLQELVRSITCTTHEIFRNLDRFYGEAPPPPHVSRELVDHPCFTPREYQYLLEEFERRLESLTSYCDRIGAAAILIVPGSNDGAFEPSRSVLAWNTPRPAREEFATQFRTARSTEASDPQKAIAIYRRLITLHPEFAESHYRLGRLLEGTGEWNQAAREFVVARDLDALPIRCQSDFRAIFRAVAGRYRSMLVDAPSILARVSPHGILDDYLYHDAHHMSLLGTIAVAEDILEQLRANHTFSWPESTPVPRIELEGCARRFEIDRKVLAKVCERSSGFYSRQAYARYDSAERIDLQQRYKRAEAAIATARPLDDSTPRSLTPMLAILKGLEVKKGANRSP